MRGLADGSYTTASSAGPGVPRSWVSSLLYLLCDSETKGFLLICLRYDFLGKLRRGFESTLVTSGLRSELLNRRTFPPGNRNLTDPEEIEKALALGEYIKKGECYLHNNANGQCTLMSCLVSSDNLETLALYSLRKYRYLKRTYSKPEGL